MNIIKFTMVNLHKQYNSLVIVLLVFPFTTTSNGTLNSKQEIQATISIDNQPILSTENKTIVPSQGLENSRTDDLLTQPAAENGIVDAQKSIDIGNRKGQNLDDSKNQTDLIKNDGSSSNQPSQDTAQPKDEDLHNKFFILDDNNPPKAPVATPLSSLTPKAPSNEHDDNYSTPKSILIYVMHTFLALNGLYILFYGFRTFRMSMIIFGFYMAYYIMVILVAHTSFYNANSIAHKVGLLIASLGFGFLLGVLTYSFESVNYFVFGSTVGIFTSVFYAQFYLDFSSEKDKFITLGIYLVIAALTIVAGHIYIQQTIIASCALIGAIAITLNFGVLIHDFLPFDEGNRLKPGSYDDFINYSIATTVLFAVGVLVQHFLRETIIQNFTSRKLGEIRGVSFLD